MGKKVDSNQHKQMSTVQLLNLHEANELHPRIQSVYSQNTTLSEPLT